MLNLNFPALSITRLIDSESLKRNRKSPQRNRRYKEEQNENFRTEKYNNQNEKLSEVLNNRRKGQKGKNQLT